MRKIQVLLMIGVLIGSFVVLTNFTFTAGDPVKPVPIPATPQRTGDAAAGYKYLTTGDYVKGGLPFDFYRMAAGSNNKNYLKREGLNAQVSHEFTVVKAPNGENLVAPNCMQCHAQLFDSTLYVGLGNTFID